MRNWFLKKSNIVFILIIGFALFQQFPLLMNNYSKKGEFISPKELSVLSHNENTTIEFPPQNGKAMAIFWASWCGPCKLEMSRLQKSVESGSIPKNSIFAINTFESPTEIRKFITENNYPFTFIEASPTLGEDLGVKVTPTTIFMDKGVVTEMNSGMSVWGIWKAEMYF